MQSPKTHEQQIRTIERKGDVPKAGDPDLDVSAQPEQNARHPDARQSEMPVSRGGLNQETRQHNKHNNPKAGA